jgi:ubiquinone/menaquinone biosynthesis C-methylase UbiE
MGVVNLYGNPAGYERYMGRWSMTLAPAFLRFACLREPSALLDMGCGTGSLVRAAAVSFPRAWLVGMDAVPDYLLHAKGTMVSGQAQFIAGLVEQMPFADGIFDGCLSLLLLQEIRERGPALHEMRRVTQPGAVVAACQWDFDHGMPLSTAIREALQAVAPYMGENLGKRQSGAFASEAELQEHWEGAGLAEVETTRLVVTQSYTGFEDLWLPLLSGSTPVTAAVAALPPEAREEVRRRLRERFLGEGGDGAFSLRAEAFAVRGRSTGPRAMA